MATENGWAAIHHRATGHATVEELGDPGRCLDCFERSPAHDRLDLTVLARELTDTGHRIDLDDAIAAFGFDRAELEAELDEEQAIEAEVQRYIEAAIKRDNAIIEQACEMAIQGGKHGVLVLRTGPMGQGAVASAEVDESVPYGQIHERPLD